MSSLAKQYSNTLYLHFLPLFLSIIILILSLFVDGRVVFTFSSIVFGYTHIAFTAQTFPKSSLKWSSLILIFLPLTVLSTLNYQVFLTYFIFVQAVHYQYQNYVFDSESWSFKKIFWCLAVLLHVLAILGHEINPSLLERQNAELVVWAIGVLLLITSGLKPTRFMPLLSLLILPLAPNKEAALAVVSTWHGAQYIFYNQWISLTAKEQQQKHLPKKLWLIGLSYGLLITIALYNFHSLIPFIAGTVLALNLTHYIVDYFYFSKRTSREA